MLFPDHFVLVRDGVGSRRSIEQAIGDLRPGVTEVYVHPASTPRAPCVRPRLVGPGRRPPAPSTDSELAVTLQRAGVHRIGFRKLRDLQRTG